MSLFKSKKTKTEEKEKLLQEALEKNFEKVRLDGMRAGATGILGAVLKMCKTGKSVGDIRRFCEKSLAKKEMQIDEGNNVLRDKE